MKISPNNIFDWKDRQLTTARGYLTFRLYASGWLVRYTPFQGITETLDQADIWSACAFANDRL